MGRAEPNVRPPGAKSPSGKPVKVVEIATPLAAAAAGERLRIGTAWHMDVRQLTVNSSQLQLQFIQLISKH